jgi:cytochrome c oxidase subunit IV
MAQAPHEPHHVTSNADPADHGTHGHHILPTSLLLKVFGVLIALTVLTVVLALAEKSGAIHLGALSVPVALAIAGVKATLVAMFFMALKYDNKINALAFVMSILFLVIFFVFTWLDTGFRHTFQHSTGAVHIDEQERLFEQQRRRVEEIQSLVEGQPLTTPVDTVILQR